jgi:hypothetical protein
MLAVADWSAKVRIFDVLASDDAGLASKPSEADLQSRWRDLESGDAVTAYRSVCALVHWRGHSVPFLEERLLAFRPVSPRQSGL